MNERNGEDRQGQSSMDAGRLAWSAGAADDGEPKLIAYRVSPGPPIRLVPAPAARDWMEATDKRFAYRCLPMLIANQSGWLLLNSHTLRATWDGGDGVRALRVEYRTRTRPFPARSHFGHGILTWRLPYLFRTPPGYNLLVRGPANWPKEGAYALEGVVEADWATVTFTMNWKMLAVGRPVIFEQSEPICMLVPQRRGELEAFRPEVRDVRDDPETDGALRLWKEDRDRFLAELRVPDSEAVKQGWQKHYFRGTSPDGTAAPAHQTRLQVREFDDRDGW
jgi:hypothetical protein